MSLEKLKYAYDEVKTAAKRSCSHKSTGLKIRKLLQVSFEFLNNSCEVVELTSKCPGKEYVSYRQIGETNLSRPSNSAYFIPDLEFILDHWDQWCEGKLADQDFGKMWYSVALAPCMAMEIFDKGNKKGPATYFEVLIGHIFSRELNCEPDKKARLPVLDRNIMLTMDLLFKLGQGKPNVHVPVKMSTRERIVQAWSHQRLLDASYGDGTYRGVMVIFSETKLDLKKKEVVEICVPDQWLAYQTLLAEMDRIYYFDVPVRYQTLTDAYPETIQIKQFGEFFKEKGDVLPLS